MVSASAGELGKRRREGAARDGCIGVGDEAMSGLGFASSAAERLH